MTVNVKEENWVGTKEAAEFLGVKPATRDVYLRYTRSFTQSRIRALWSVS